MKYIKTFSGYINEDTQGLRDYQDKYPMSFKTQAIPPADRKDVDTMAKEVDFQRIQTEMQEILLQYLKKSNPNAEQNDAVLASDRFCKQLGEKGQVIKDIVDSSKGDYKKAAQKIIEKFKKEIVNNYYRKDDNPVQQGGSEMSREGYDSYLKTPIPEEDKYHQESNFKRSGLMVFGITPLDRDQINDFLSSSNYYAEYNSEFKSWFFPEDEENYDQLEWELNDEFNKLGIDARFEGIF